MLFFIVLQTFACDICGCGGGNFYLGLLPQFKNKFIGLRYHYAQFHTVLANDPTQFSHNFYNSVELWGGWNISPKWQVLAFVPYYFNKQADDDGTTYKNGIGDITLLVNYEVFHLRSAGGTHATVEQSLRFGGGVKLPTGSFQVDPTDSTTTIADINAQIGTGSTDILLNTIYNIRINRMGINASLNYKIGTTNNASYKFGNKFTANTIAYYRIPLHHISLSPNAGMLYERTDKNLLKKETVDLTGSHSLSALAGLELSVNDGIAMGLNIQAPVSQDFAGGQTRFQLRAMMHVTVSL